MPSSTTPDDIRMTTYWVPSGFDYATTSIQEDAATRLELEASATSTGMVTGIDGKTLPSPHARHIAILISVVIGIVIFITVMGNLLVVVAFSMTPKLRNYNNYFILGLAIADTLVGAVDMPLFALIIISGRWPLGAIFCDIFTFLDHAFSHISILLVTLISLDRCVALTHPFRHRRHWRRRSRAILIIAISYIVPVVIWLPVTALWQVIYGIVDRPIPNDVCEPLYIHYSVIASVLVPTVFLMIPFTITAILSIRIYIAIKAFYKNRKTMKITFGNADSAGARAAASDSETQVISDTGFDGGVSQDGGNKTKSSKPESERNETKYKIGNETLKGVRTLVFIIAAMGIAWFPLTFVIIISAICPTCLPGAVYSVAVFWGYTNSLMNPICYALADKAFKDAFVRILTLGCLRKERKLSLGSGEI